MASAMVLPAPTAELKSHSILKIIVVSVTWPRVCRRAVDFTGDCKIHARDLTGDG